MEHYKFFQNKECEYFPCHKTEHPEDFNCLFCYCPLYCLGDKCGGNFTYTKNGVKSCVNCLRPHVRDNYKDITSQFGKIKDLMEKNKED
ncbi:MAG: cysteine-rich small domain-containing protein [Pseudobutyrivibrio sp.]|nr:cysteine-rich small domain-containing protein [Pseudobutyrivibrio sp.]